MIAKSDAHKRDYVRPIPSNWWLQRKPYTVFMFRELSSGFLALYAILLFKLLHRAADPAAFHQLYADLTGPIFMVLHVVVLGFALLNTITTFTLAPRVLKLYRGEEKVPERLIAGVHFAGWAVVSLALILIAWKL